MSEPRRGFVGDRGLVVNVAESEAGAAAGRGLHAVLAAPHVQLGARPVEDAAVWLGIPGDPDQRHPDLLIRALLDRSGELVDSFEQNAPGHLVDPALPLPPLAVPDALDSLDSAWRLVFSPLLSICATHKRRGFDTPDGWSRGSHHEVANVLDAAKVDDSLLPSTDSRAAGALNRIKARIGSG